MLRLILAVVESLYFYLRLYTNLRRKRLLFRRKHLLFQDDKQVIVNVNRKNQQNHDPSTLGGELFVCLVFLHIVIIYLSTLFSENPQF
jgi:hypothetical protein